MRKGKLIDVTNKVDSIDTFESYSNECYLNESTFLVPFIKLELIEQNVFENIEERVNIEFSYLIFELVKEISWIGEDGKGSKIVGGTKIGSKKDSDLTKWIAINRDRDGYELKVVFERLLIFVPSESRTGKEWWVHKKTPNFPQNVNEVKARDFFNLKNVPADLEQSLPLNTFSKVSFEKALNEEIAVIESNWAKHSTPYNNA